MKKLFAISLAVLVAAAAFAQPQGGQKKQGGKPDFEKIKAEKVAFITSEVGLTAKEAEAFWPIYNKVESEQAELRKAEHQASAALRKAINEGSNADALLNDYIKAKEANVNLHLKAAKDYKKVLSADKVAKFYLCEEKFLRQQLGKLGGGHKGHGAPGGFNRGGKPGNFKGGKPDGFKGDGNFPPRPDGNFPPAEQKAE